MSIDVAALKNSVDMVSIIGSYTSLKRLGSEWVGPCPLHNGDGDNFNVVPQKGLWMCWSHNCHDQGDAGNDIIGFIQRAEGLDFPKACEFLGAKNEWKPMPMRAVPPRADRITLKPPLGNELPLAKMATRLLGIPEIARPFYDLDGSLICYEARYRRGVEPSAPDKSPSRMWTWGCRAGEEPQWGCGKPSGWRPLYGLDRLASKPAAQVIVFEGPKKADAGHARLPRNACISWTGGAGAWAKHDWKPLAGRNVVLWPDADDVSVTACKKLAEHLVDPKGSNCAVKLVNPFKP